MIALYTMQHCYVVELSSNVLIFERLPSCMCFIVDRLGHSGLGREFPGTSMFHWGECYLFLGRRRKSQRGKKGRNLNEQIENTRSPLRVAKKPQLTVHLIPLVRGVNFAVLIDFTGNAGRLEVSEDGLM